MRCRRARKALLEKELGLPVSGGAGAPDEHLAGCPACAAHAAAEAFLTAELTALRVEPDLAIDVTERVVCGLADARPERVDVPAGQLGWASAAAVAGALAILAGLWPLLPELYRLAREGWALASGLRLMATRMAVAGSAVLSATVEAGRTAAEALAPVVSLLEGLQPLAMAALTACALVMASTIVLVVGRDLRGATYSRGTSK